METIADNQINADVEQSMILTHEIIRLLHESRANKAIAIGALEAALSHVRCLVPVTPGHGGV